MSISVNEGGKLFELDIISANEGGQLFELDIISANEGGVLNEIFNTLRTLVVLWDDGTLENSHTVTKGHSETTVGTFTLKTSTVVKMTGTFALDSNSEVLGNGTAAIITSNDTVVNIALMPDRDFSYTRELSPGEYTIVINGGGGDQSGGWCGYRTTCTLTFTKP